MTKRKPVDRRFVPFPATLDTYDPFLQDRVGGLLPPFHELAIKYGLLYIEGLPFDPLIATHYIFLPKLRPEFANCGGWQLREHQSVGRNIYEKAWNPTLLHYLLEHSKTDCLAFDIADDLAVAALTQGWSIPGILWNWINEVRNGSLRRPRPPRQGSHPKARELRNFAIFHEIGWEMMKGRAARRNDAAKHANSACDLVASRRGMEYGTVRKIFEAWEKRLKEEQARLRSKTAN